MPSRTSRFRITPTRKKLRKPRTAPRRRENTGNSTTCSSRPGSLKFRKLRETAQALKLNVGDFNKCLDSSEQADLVKKQFDESQTLGLPGTPAFFVNGRLINPNGTVSYDTLRQLIEEELATSSQRARDTASATGGVRSATQLKGTMKHSSAKLCCGRPQGDAENSLRR